MATNFFNPFTFPLDVQRELTTRMSDAMDTATVASDRAETMADVEVGGTPSEVVYEENKLELLRYEPQVPESERQDVPILIVYALINRPYILDLQPDRSVVRRLLEAGFDVYLIDWGEPSALDASLGLEDYVVRYVDNCVDVVREDVGVDDVNLLGYCMGGTMSVMYTALFPEKVRNLGLMAAGLCFAGEGGVLERWGDEDYYDPEKLTETFGNVPSDFLDVGFAMMDPIDNSVSKYVQLYENLENEDFVENFARMETWLSDGIDVAGRAYREFLEGIYQKNSLYRNEFYLGDRHVDIESIDVPVIQIVGEYDHLIPPGASKPFNDVVGSDDTEIIEASTGHIGLSVSSSSHDSLWPRVAEWYAERSVLGEETESADAAGDAAPDAAEEDAAPDAAEEDTDGDSGVETVSGIGPTYAERLREAGIETVDDLLASDVDTVAAASGAPEARVRDWFEHASE